jgi:hypothetical protein
MCRSHDRRIPQGTIVAGRQISCRDTGMTDWATLLGWVGIRRPLASPVPQRATKIFALEESAPRVPREYRALYTYLEHRYASVVVLTFEQIEALLGFALPMSARTERDWWTEVVDPQRHCAAWTGAGRTAAPNLAAGIITFERPV